MTNLLTSSQYYSPTARSRTLLSNVFSLLNLSYLQYQQIFILEYHSSINYTKGRLRTNDIRDITTFIISKVGEESTLNVLSPTNMKHLHDFELEIFRLFTHIKNNK